MIAAEDISVYKNEVITAIGLFASTDYEPERNEHRFRQISSSFIRKCTCPCTNLGLTVYIYKSNRLFSPYIRVNKRVYSDCTLLLVCILAGMFFKRVRQPRPFSMVFFHRFVSHYLNFFVHSYLEPYNCKYAFTRMIEAALLPARLVSSPLALLSREVYVLRHVLPKMLSFSLVCLALLFSSCAILKLCALQIRHRFRSIYPFFLLVSFVFFFPRAHPIVSIFSESMKFISGIVISNCYGV